jgi:hypothetical protein
MSDLHLEFGSFELEFIGEDALVLAGDVGVGTQGVEWASAYYERTGVASIMIPGNHEFYGRDLPLTLTELSVPRPGVIFLENGTFENLVRFVGCTLWTDYRLGCSDRVGAMFYADRAMADHDLIRIDGRRFRPQDAAVLHDESRRFLAETLMKRCSTVVMTHHLPSRRSIAATYADSPLNPAYASDLDQMVKYSGAKLWVHGHTHVSRDYVIGDTRVICNPRGYHGFELNPDFDPNLIVEV